MGFWQDSSPIVKGALIVGGLGAVYLLLAVIAGLPPFPGGCAEECDNGSECVEGECVQNDRGMQR